MADLSWLFCSRNTKLLFHNWIKPLKEQWKWLLNQVDLTCDAMLKIEMTLKQTCSINLLTGSKMPFFGSGLKWRSIHPTSLLDNVCILAWAPRYSYEFLWYCSFQYPAEFPSGKSEKRKKSSTRCLVLFSVSLGWWCLVVLPRAV